MSVINFPEYAQAMTACLNELMISGKVISMSYEIDQRSNYRGYIKGISRFHDGSELHFREFIDLTLSNHKIMYAYHYQDENGALIFRYDNANHRPPLSQREHKHLPSDILLVPAPTLDEVFAEILL